MGADHDIADAVGAIRRCVDSGGTLGLMCHVSPDGDALGSMLGLHHLALSQGVRSVASFPNPFVVAAHYRSVPGTDLLVSSAEFPAEPDLVVTFDCGSLGRLVELGGPASAAKDRGALIVLDHHATNDRYGSINVVQTKAAATAVVVRELARELGWPLTREAATCLYVGLVTDTGRFQFSSTNPSVFTLAAELMAFDIPVSRLNRELFDEHSYAYLQLASRVLGRAVLDADREMIYTNVSQADLTEFGVPYDEVEGLIEWIRSASEAEVAVIYKEATDGVRVSMRSLSKVDIGAVAVSLGGGGHVRAAGFTMCAPVADVHRLLVEKLDAAARLAG
jgi:bifunctional oligoribonuclease and PAP phosphatase NrnA